MEKCGLTKRSALADSKSCIICYVVLCAAGDRNHGLFWAYIMIQFSLNIWAGHLLLSEVCACLAIGEAGLGTLQGCRLHTLPHWGLVLACLGLVAVTGVLFGYLAILHSYLLLTGQTMFEILRGSKVSYLAPYYRGRARFQYRLPQEIVYLFWDELTGRGPPRPFSQGMVNNLLLQLCSPWPRPYITQ